MPRGSLNPSANGLFSKLKERAEQAFEAAKNEETTYGNLELPPGIEGGVARLIKCGLGRVADGKQLAGEPYFRAEGIVLEPLCLPPPGPDGSAPAGSRPCRGLRTSIMEMLCDTPAKAGTERARETFEQHMSWMMNELRKLGLDTASLDYDNLEAAMKELETQQPLFYFRTWQGQPTAAFPNPRVNHQWVKLADNYTPDEDPSDGVQDRTPPAPAPKPAPAAAPAKKPAPAPASAAKPVAAPAKAPAPRAAAAPAATATATAEPDLDALAARADKGDKTATAELERLGAEAGLDEETLTNAQTWIDVVEMIRAATDEAPAPDEPTAEPAAAEPPEKGNIYLYQPPGAPKPIECEVMGVNSVKQTVNLRSLDTKKPFNAVPWTALMR